MNQALELVRGRARALLNYRRSDEGGWRRATLLGALGLATSVGFYFGAEWFLARVVEVEPIGVVMVRRLLGLILLFVFAILTFSNLIAAFSTLYLAEDLPLLVAQPLSPYALYAARFTETAAIASWMTLCFSLPFFLAIGAVMEAGPGYYGALALVLVALAAIPTAVALVLALALGNIASARRTRQALVVLVTVLFAIGFVLFRGLEPERFLNPDERAPMLEVLRTLQGSDPAWLPSTWALDALWAELSARGEVRTHPVALLAAGAAAGFFAAGWAFRGLYPRAFWRAQEGGVASQGGSRGRRRRSLRSGRHGARRAVLTKDVRVFWRDTGQWTQLALIVALVVIYVVNFKYIRTVGDTGIITRTGLHFVNMALGGFVAVAASARFCFPAVSLEGRAFWLYLCSPNRVLDLLHAKWLALALPLVLLSDVLVVLTNLWLDSGGPLTVAAVLTMTPLTVGVVGLAIGLGARYPRFRIDNPARIATGFGGVLYMILGLLVLIATVVAAAWPTLLAAQVLAGGQPPGTGAAVGAIASGLLAGLGPPALGAWTIRGGARALERRDVV